MHRRNVVGFSECQQDGLMTRTPWSHWGTINSVKIPCKPDCPDRSETCHGTCEKYKKYCEENGKVKKKEKEWEKNYWR